MQPNYMQRFQIHFANDNSALAVRVSPNTNPDDIIRVLGLEHRPSLFITGGASGMAAEDIRRTEEIVGAIADFAVENQITVIDGGTESGVMQMMGEARRQRKGAFTLVGVSPGPKISYPGHLNPGAEAELEDSHSAFVLVDTPEWGGESEMLVRLPKALAAPQHVVCGVLINGGKIAAQDVIFAVSRELPILVLEGSGRFADEVATAFKTGRANQAILRAILAGGDIQLVSTLDGPSAMRTKLSSRYHKS
jgi:hypothetical protein